MRKYISITCAAVMAASLLSACGETVTTETSVSADTAQSENVTVETSSAAISSVESGASDSNSLQIVTTIFPEYDWVNSILGENPAGADVTMLLDNGVDLHSYQPTAEDIMKISTCDLFIYVGGESDGWVDDALKESTNPDMVVINLLDVLGDNVKEEEIVEGMEHEHEHEDGEEHDSEAEDHEHGSAEDSHDESEEKHDHEDGEEHDHEDGEIEYDEHVWLSLDYAEELCDSIEQALVAIDPANKAVYEANAKAYDEKLEALDEEYKSTVENASQKTLLFGDRFPFRYLVDDYGLNYYAAFAGCSAETEASFETITFLAGKVDELSLSSIMTIESGDHKIAETIKENTQNKDQEILTLDSMQSTTSEDVANGTTYLSIMESNLEVLKKALK